MSAGWFRPAVADFLASVNLLGYLIGAVIAGHFLAHRMPGPWLRAAMLVAAGSLAACALPWGFVWYFVWRLAAGIAAGVLMVLA
ncbi:MAG: YbfB/YjiJ family MFS transporter, partial [Terriglobales bacterium]